MTSVLSTTAKISGIDVSHIIVSRTDDGLIHISFHGGAENRVAMVSLDAKDFAALTDVRRMLHLADMLGVDSVVINCGGFNK